MDSLVSIVVANYNCSKYIGEFIESIINQHYNNWELLIVDDGSNDGSQDIVRSYSDKNSRVSLISREINPKGANHCRNIGLGLAKGDYICFFDSDDIVPEYAIKDRVMEMQDNPEMDFIVFPAITFKETPYDFNNLAIGIRTFKDDKSMFLKRYRLPFAVWTNIYRREFLIKNSIEWDNNLMSMQDSDFNLSVLDLKVKYKYSENKRPSYFWRQVDDGKNITRSIKTIKNISNQLYFFSKLKSRYLETKYEKDLFCFGLTLLHRTIYLNYEKLPDVLISGKYELCKYKCIRWILSKLKVEREKISYSIFMLFYPKYLMKEVYYRIKNVQYVNKYFNINVR